MHTQDTHSTHTHNKYSRITSPVYNTAVLLSVPLLTDPTYGRYTDLSVFHPHPAALGHMDA